MKKRSKGADSENGTGATKDGGDIKSGCERREKGHVLESPVHPLARQGSTVLTAGFVSQLRPSTGNVTVNKPPESSV